MGDAIRRLVMSGARFTRLDTLARPWLGGVGAILMLHRVTANPRRADSPNSGLTIAPAFLNAMIEAMKRDGFTFVSLDEALDRLRAGRANGRFATLTADDGYRDNLHEALPVLEAQGTPLTVYVAPALTDRTHPMWWEAIEDIVEAGLPIELPESGEVLSCDGRESRIKAFRRLVAFFSRELPEARQKAVVETLARRAGTDPYKPGRDILLDWEEVRKLAVHPLVTIGAHTVNHVNLRRLPAEDALAEMEVSRDRLGAELGKAPRHFAYPYGSPEAAGLREAQLAESAGFASAVTTRHGMIQENHAQHLHALPRISLNGRFQNLGEALVMTRGLTVPLANRGRVCVTV